MVRLSKAETLTLFPWHVNYLTSTWLKRRLSCCIGEHLRAVHLICRKATLTRTRNPPLPLPTLYRLTTPAPGSVASSHGRRA